MLQNFKFVLGPAGGAYSAPRPLSWFKGALILTAGEGKERVRKGEEREVEGRRGEREGREGDRGKGRKLETTPSSIPAFAAGEERSPKHG